MTRFQASTSAWPPPAEGGSRPRTAGRTLPSPLQRVRGVLAEDRALALLLPEARRLRELNRLFARAAPAGLAHACRVAAVTGETALIHCGHGAAAARLRSQAESLARALSTEDRVIATIKVKVRADWAAPDRPVKQGMNDTALSAWLALDQALPPGGLKDAVDRLLRHHSGFRLQGTGFRPVCAPQSGADVLTDPRNLNPET